MTKQATLALLVTVGLAAPAWAQEIACESPSNVFAFSSNRHNTTGTPPLNSTDIYLMDVDQNGMPLSNARQLPGSDDHIVPAADFIPALSPDGKGRIVFDSNRARDATWEPVNTSDLFLMNHDGTDQRPLTRGSSATWSPNGKRIAFHASASGTGQPIKQDPGAPTDDSVIFTARVGDLLKGGVPTQITQPDPGQVDDDADWSPVGKKIAFTRKNRDEPDPTNPISAEIYMINVDGRGLTRLTTNTEEERSPAWSPDGKLIAYSCRKGSQGGNTLEICVMNVADGTVQKLTDNILADLGPHWSPDGKKILFQRAPPVMGQGQQIWVMNANGTGQTRVMVPPPLPGFTMHPTWGEIKAKCDDEDDEDDDDDEDDGDEDDEEDDIGRDRS